MVMLLALPAACLAALLGGATAFAPPAHSGRILQGCPGAGSCMAAPGWRQARSKSLCMGLEGVDAGAVSRRRFAASALASAAAAIAGAPSLAGASVTSAADKAEQDFEESLATLMVAKAVLEPSHKYFAIKQYDWARSNVKYVLNQLAIRKAIGKVVVEGAYLCEDDALIEEASELAASADTTFSNYDSSIYTVIFIPASEDGSLPNGSDKYFMQADHFYEQCINTLDVLISLAPPDAAKRAAATAENRVAQLPQFLFKDTSVVGRAPTP